MDVGQAEVAALEAVGQSRVVESQEMQDRRVEIVNVHGVARDVESELVRLAVGDSRLECRRRRATS